MARSQRGRSSADFIINTAEYSFQQGHCFNPAKLCVVDIDPNTIVDSASFVMAVQADRRVNYFLFPPKDPAFHLEMTVTAAAPAVTSAGPTV
jgi:hypothetical protein